MKKIFLSFILSLFLLPVSQALAFDATDGNWRGGYTGVFLGGSSADFTHNESDIGPSGTDSSFTGGGDIGYNLEYKKFVYGGEIDASALFNQSKSENTKFDEDWMVTMRARAGYDMGKILPYVTLGGAFTNTVSETPDDHKHMNVDPGVALGAGLDINLTPRWFTRIEYLHVDVPNVDSTSNGVTMNGGSGNNILRVGIDHRF